MRPDKNFRMKKSSKRLLALMPFTGSARVEYKHALIQSQLAEEAAHRAALKAKADK